MGKGGARGNGVADMRNPRRGAHAHSPQRADGVGRGGTASKHGADCACGGGRPAEGCTGPQPTEGRRSGKGRDGRWSQKLAASVARSVSHKEAMNGKKLETARWIPFTS